MAAAGYLPDVEAAESLGGWAVAALCRCLSLENILTYLTAALLERQVGRERACVRARAPQPSLPPARPWCRMRSPCTRFTAPPPRLPCASGGGVLPKPGAAVGRGPGARPPAAALLLAVRHAARAASLNRAARGGRGEVAAQEDGAHEQFGRAAIACTLAWAPSACLSCRPPTCAPPPLLSAAQAPVPFVLGILYKTAEVRSKCGGLIRVNVYKDRVKNAGQLPPLPQQAALAEALAAPYAALRQEGLKHEACTRPVHAVTGARVCVRASVCVCARAVACWQFGERVGGVSSRGQGGARHRPRPPAFDPCLPPSRLQTRSTRTPRLSSPPCSATCGGL